MHFMQLAYIYFLYPSVTFESHPIRWLIQRNANLSFFSDLASRVLVIFRDTREIVCNELVLNLYYFMTSNSLISLRDGIRSHTSKDVV